MTLADACDWQPKRAAVRGCRAPGDVGFDLQRWHLGWERGEHIAGFGPRDVRAQAMVRASAEREPPRVGAFRVEHIGMPEAPLVVVRCPEQQRHLLAGPDKLTADDHILDRVAAD